MKLYVLMSSYDYEGSQFLGLYSSLEGAKADLDEKEGTVFFGDSFYILETESDKPGEDMNVFERERTVI